MIDFEWYRSFISIYKHRSVSAAAKARILTQPAMSQHLAALEAEVGEPLFIRAPRKMIPTDKGKDLYTKVVPLIESLEKASLELKHESSSLAPIIRIGSPVEYFTKGALHKIKDVNLRFTVQFGVAQLLLEKLERDEVDFIITTQKLQQAGIDCVKIEDETFVIAAPAQLEEPSLQQDELEAWLKKQKWLTYGLELPIIRRYWREHFKKRPDIQAAHVVPDLRAILEAIEQGMGISVLPTYLVQDSIAQNRSKVLFSTLHVSNTIYAAYKSDHKSHPAFQEILLKLQK